MDCRQCVEAEDGAAALALLCAHKVDFVISNINLPKMNGFELLKAVKADAALEHLPVSMVTAEARKEDIVRSTRTRMLTGQMMRRVACLATDRRQASSRCSSWRRARATTWRRARAKSTICSRASASDEARHACRAASDAMRSGPKHRLIRRIVDSGAFQ